MTGLKPSRKAAKNKSFRNLQLETGTEDQVLQSPKQGAANNRLARHSSRIMLKQCRSTGPALNWQFLKGPSA